MRQIYFPIEDEKGWRMRYNTEIYDLHEDMKVIAFIKFRQLQWAGYIMRMVEHCMAKEVLQQIIDSKRRVGKPRERWEDGVRDDGIMLLDTQASKTKANDRESWGQCIERAKGKFWAVTTLQNQNS